METQANEKANDVHQQRARKCGQRKGRVGRTKVPTDPKLELFMWQGRRLKVRSGAVINASRALPTPTYLISPHSTPQDLDVEGYIDIGEPEPREEVSSSATATIAPTTPTSPLLSSLKHQPAPITFKLKPKKTINSFQYFVKDQRLAHSNLPQRELLRLASINWKALTPEQRKPYQEKGETDKQRYVDDRSSIMLYGAIV